MIFLPSLTFSGELPAVIILKPPYITKITAIGKATLKMAKVNTFSPNLKRSQKSQSKPLQGTNPSLAACAKLKNKNVKIFIDYLSYSPLLPALFAAIICRSKPIQWLEKIFFSLHYCPAVSRTRRSWLAWQKRRYLNHSSIFGLNFAMPAAGQRPLNILRQIVLALSLT